MPSGTTLLLFALATVTLVAIPGPNVAYIATRSISEGRSAGVASALGVAAGTAVHVLAAVVGLSALIASSGTAFGVVRYLGAAYLVFLGVRALIRPASPSAASPRPRAAARRAFVEGMVVNLLNPKVILFFLAFLPQFVDVSRGSPEIQTLALGAVFWMIALPMDLGWVFASDGLARRVRRRSPRAAGPGRIVTGVVYLGLGAFAAAFGGGRARSS